MLEAIIPSIWGAKKISETLYNNLYKAAWNQMNLVHVSWQNYMRVMEMHAEQSVCDYKKYTYLKNANNAYRVNSDNLFRISK